MIGIDLDGVLADFNRPMLDKLNEYNRRNGKVVIQEGEPLFTSWDWGIKWFGARAWHAVWEELDYRWWRGLPPLATPHEFARLRAIIECRPVTFISHRPVEFRQASAQWLVRHLNMAGTNFSILHTPHKGQLAAALGCEMIVDDKPENLMDVHLWAPECKRMLLWQSWNTDHWQNPAMTGYPTLDAVLVEMEKPYVR